MLYIPKAAIVPINDIIIDICAPFVLLTNIGDILGM